LAVIEERRRLSQDIDASLRTSLATVAELARALDDEPDPRPRLKGIQAEASRANLDLRQRLGLLRADEEVTDVGPATTLSEPQPRLLGDLSLTAATLAMAAIEMTLLAPMEGVRPTPPQIALTMAAAATVLGRLRRPELAAATCAVILMVGSALGDPVLDGFWLAFTLGLLGWSCAALATVGAWLAIGALAVGSAASRLLGHSSNGAILLVLFAVCVAGGATVGRSRRCEAAARVRAETWQGEVRAADATARSAERRAMARELHDVVSHAVSVIAVQAGAAEMAWSVDPAASRRAVETIGTVADQAMTELDRMIPSRVLVSRDLDDLRALVARMAAAGLRVTLELSSNVQAPVPETVYRVVQETLTNVLRHAPSSQAAVRIDAEPECTTIVVTDDGPGSAADSRRGYGLIGLSERLRQAGGSLVARSAPEVSGFEVIAVLPNRTPVVAS
jgi:signal transduction histidine kinase